MEVSGRIQTHSQGSHTSVDCDPCLIHGNNIPAKSYCEDCTYFLCDICAESHKEARNHRILDSDEMTRRKLTSEQEMLCTNHANKQIDYFCEKHEQLCCSACVTLEHRQCKVLYIDHIAREFNTSQEYQDLQKQIKLLETKLTKTKKQSEKNCNDVNQYFETLLSDIEQFRSQINIKLDEIERTTKERALKITTDDLISLESISTKTESIQKHLSEMSSTLESLEKYKQNHQLFITTKTYLKQVMNFNKQTDKISSENKIRTYLFTWNEEILQSLDLCCELVDLNVTDREKRGLRGEKQSQGEGNIMYKDPKQIKARFVKDINIQHKQDSAWRGCWITGSDLLTCDTLALTDRDNYSVKLVDLHTNAITSCLQLADQPRDLTYMDSNTLVVTCGTNLTFLKFDGNLSITNKMPMKGRCHGITSHQNKLFVTFTGNKPSIKILNNAGAVLHTIQTDSHGKKLFVDPLYITVSTDGRIIYVSDPGQNTVTSYSLTGEQLNVYIHENLNCPQGLTVVENKLVFVCGNGSDNLHGISCLCEHIQIVLDGSSKNVGRQPWTVLYNKKYNRIYISYGDWYRNRYVSVFELE